MSNSGKITGGIYLVIDPSVQKETLITKLTSALVGGISVVQVWNKWDETVNKTEIISAICHACKSYHVPVLVNEDWKLLRQYPSLDGVHFDKIPGDYEAIKKEVNREFITGITCGNDLKNVHWAIENQLDYISFCSMFPSASAGSCEIVPPSIINDTRQLTDIPIFIAGGVTPENTIVLAQSISFDGIAVVGGIFKADDPMLQTRKYINALQKN
ncbi:MAG: thiamine phosphate synthase [Ferruginibacter sp.]